MEFNIDFGKLFRKFINYVKPDLPREVPVPVINSYERFQGSVESILAYRSFDDDSNVCFLDDGKNPAVGIIVEYTIPENSWTQWYSWLESFVVQLPVGATVLFGRLSTPLREDDLQSLDIKSNNDFMEKLISFEKQLILETSTGNSLLSRNRLNSRKVTAYIAIKLPYTGSPNNLVAINKFTNYVESVRSEVVKQIYDCNGSYQTVDKSRLELLLRQLASPMSDPLDEDNFANSTEVGPFKLFNSDYTRYIDSEGYLTYATIDGEGEYIPELSIATLTADSFPSDLSHLQVQKAIAADMSYKDQIVCPYWAYSIVEVINQEERNKLVEISGSYSKNHQDKPWFYDYYVNELPPEQFEKKQLKFLMGVNLYSPPENLEENIKMAVTAFSNQGFRLVDEVFLGFPLFLTSLPFQYSPTLTAINRFTYTLADKALFTGYTSDISSKLSEKEIPAFTRAGAICGINIDDIVGSVLVGKSDSGKSVLMGCAIENLLNNDKNVCILSEGPGFKDFVSVWGGGSYSIAKEETGLNFFSLIKEEAVLKAHMPSIVGLFESMLELVETYWDEKNYPLVEKAILAAWKAHKTNTTFDHVVAAMKQINDELYSRLIKLTTTKTAPILNRPVSFAHKNKNVLEIRVDEVDGLKIPYLMWASLCLKILLNNGIFVLDNASAFEEDIAAGFFFKRFSEQIHNQGIWGISSFKDDPEEGWVEDILYVDLQLKSIVFMQDEDAIISAIRNKRIKEDNRVVSVLRSIRAFPDSFEIAVEHGDTFKVFLVVKHYSQYLLMTSSLLEKERVNRLISEGYSLEKALIKLSQDYYNNKWGNE